MLRSRNCFDDYNHRNRMLQVNKEATARSLSTLSRGGCDYWRTKTCKDLKCQGLRRPSIETTKGSLDATGCRDISVDRNLYSLTSPRGLSSRTPSPVWITDGSNALRQPSTTPGLGPSQAPTLCLYQRMQAGAVEGLSIIDSHDITPLLRS